MEILTELGLPHPQKLCQTMFFQRFPSHDSEPAFRELVNRYKHFAPVRFAQVSKNSVRRCCVGIQRALV